MKTVQVNDITPHLLTQENEPLAIECQGHLLGYIKVLPSQLLSAEDTSTPHLLR